MLIVLSNKITFPLCSSLSYKYRKNRKYRIRHSDICKYFTLSVPLLHRLLHSYVSISFILFYTPVSLSFSWFPSPGQIWCQIRNQHKNWTIETRLLLTFGPKTTIVGNVTGPYVKNSAFFLFFLLYFL